MFVYYYRIFDRYGVDVVSLAVCTDVLPASHTAPDQRARWGCELTFRFPVVQIRDTGRDWAALEQDLNPFAVEVPQFEEEEHMPYVTSVERFGMQKGFEQGQLQATREMLLEAVATRFGEVPQDVTAAVQRLETRETLRGLLRQALTCASLETFRDALRTVQG